jgi:hypothetical protein
MALSAFEEKLLLAVIPILVTAVLAGLIVPLVLRIVEARKAVSMKRFEAELARQAKVIEAQAALLDNITEAMWTWRYQLMRVTYAGAQQSDEALNVAWRAYDEKMWDSLHAIRVQVTRARRLVSEKAYDSLQDQYRRIIEVDRRLGAAMKLAPEVRRRDLEELNLEVFEQVSEDIDASLHMVAEEVRLISPEATKR